ADPAIPAETSERFTRSLESIAAAATEEDRTRPVGERLGNASRKLLNESARTAAREFEELAKHFRELAAREEAKAKLDELAKNLREAGSEMSGSELKKMEEIAQESGKTSSQGTPAGLLPLDADTLGSESAGQGMTAAEEKAAGEPGEGPTLAQVPKESVSELPVPGAAPGVGDRGEVNAPQNGRHSIAAPVTGEKYARRRHITGMSLTCL